VGDPKKKVKKKVPGSALELSVTYFTSSTVSSSTCKSSPHTCELAARGLGSVLADGANRVNRELAGRVDSPDTLAPPDLVHLWLNQS
jgi:hypothetical protein